MTLRAVTALGVVLSVACGTDRGSSPTQPTQTPPSPGIATISAVARNYLEQIVTIMQNNSIKRLTIDWTAFRTAVFDAAKDAQTIVDPLPAGQAYGDRIAPDDTITEREQILPRAIAWLQTRR